jgi:membrane protein DedA with SNARE-associated domain
VPDYGKMIWSFLTWFGLLVAAGLGAPFPEELLIPGAGLWVAANPEYGPLRWLMFPICILGVIIADGFLYTIGRLYGTRLFEHRWLARLFPAEKRQRIENNFHHYGVGILLVGRLLPGIRGPLFLTAGMMRLPLARFLLADGLGAVLGNSLLFFLAWWFGDQVLELIERIKADLVWARPMIILAAILALAAYLTYLFLRRPVSTGDPEELPLIGHQVATRLESGSHRGVGHPQPSDGKADPPPETKPEEPVPAKSEDGSPG